MESRTYDLEEVDVYAYKNYQGFKQDFLNLDIPQEKTAFIPPLPYAYSGNTNPTLTLNSPFTMIYNKFSRRAKEEKKVAGLKVENNLKQEAFRKYNKEFVASVLKIKDKELDDFMQYCQLDTDYILRSTEYELALAVKNCYASFKN